MEVPKAPVHKDDFAPRGKHQVRPSRQIFPMQTIAITQSVKQSAHLHFRLHAFGFDLRHYVTADLRCYCVDHCQPCCK